MNVRLRSSNGGNLLQTVHAMRQSVTRCGWPFRRNWDRQVTEPVTCRGCLRSLGMGGSR